MAAVLADFVVGDGCADGRAEAAAHRADATGERKRKATRIGADAAGICGSNQNRAGPSQHAIDSAGVVDVGVNFVVDAVGRARAGAR